jgi:hypothetical protein
VSERPSDDTERDDNSPGDSRLETAEKMARVVELRRRKLTFQQIGDELGHSRQWCHTLYERALADIPASSVHAHRLEMLDDLNEAEAAVLAVLRANHVVVSNGHIVSEVTGQDDDGRPIYGEPLTDHGPVLDAARTLAVLQARRAKLTGADAPTQVETSGTVTTYTVDLGGDADAAREALT